MFLIRVFLWALVGAITLQGWLHADDYSFGSPISSTSHLNLGTSVSIWQEILVTGLTSLLWKPTNNGLPRCIVRSLIKETARHPELKTAPALQEALSIHERVMTEFRQTEMAWLLQHVDIVTMVANEKQSMIATWAERVDTVEKQLASEKKKFCMTQSSECRIQREYLENEKQIAERGRQLWKQVLSIEETGISVTEFIESSQEICIVASWKEAWQKALAELHRVTDWNDSRLWQMQRQAMEMVTSLLWPDVIIIRLIDSLFQGEIWGACRQHLQRREMRLRGLASSVGLANLHAAQEKEMNASLRLVSGANEEMTVRTWFAEIAVNGWWPGADIPGLVRRCLSIETGECVRVGSTEIAALSAQHGESLRLADDWSRRLFIGMWNALPALAVIMIVEVVCLYIHQRRQVKQPVYLQLPANLPAIAPALTDT